LANDIISSAVLPAGEGKGLSPKCGKRSGQFVHDCESRLYPHRDEALIPGYAHEKEYDISKPNTLRATINGLQRTTPTK
jgi:hypothetical protein